MTAPQFDYKLMPTGSTDTGLIRYGMATISYSQAATHPPLRYEPYGPQPGSDDVPELIARHVRRPFRLIRWRDYPRSCDLRLDDGRCIVVSVSLILRGQSSVYPIAGPHCEVVVCGPGPGAIIHYGPYSVNQYEKLINDGLMSGESPELEQAEDCDVFSTDIPRIACKYKKGETS